MKLSWQVTGGRHDAYAEANRIQVEVEKPLQEQGRYLHPELFGAAPEPAVGYVAPSPMHPAGELSGSLAVNGIRVLYEWVGHPRLEPAVAVTRRFAP